MAIIFDTKKHIKKIVNGKWYLHTFVDRKNLEVGIYRLKPGQKDDQEPHEHDEIYYIIHGDGIFKIGKKSCPVSEGMLYFVGKNTEHGFQEHTKEIVTLYFFGDMGIVKKKN